jgi:hypothetical protein
MSYNYSNTCKFISWEASSGSVIFVLGKSCINNYRWDSFSLIHVTSNKSYSSATNETEDPYLNQNLLAHRTMQTHFRNMQVRRHVTIHFTEPRKDPLMWRRCCQNSWVWKLSAFWCISCNTSNFSMKILEIPITMKIRARVLYTVTAMSVQIQCNYEHISCKLFLELCCTIINFIVDVETISKLINMEYIWSSAHFSSSKFLSQERGTIFLQ